MQHLHVLCQVRKENDFQVERSVCTVIKLLVQQKITVADARDQCTSRGALETWLRGGERLLWGKCLMKSIEGTVQLKSNVGATID